MSQFRGILRQKIEHWRYAALNVLIIWWLRIFNTDFDTPTIGEKTHAEAIMDRLTHLAHRIELHGESLRKKSNKNILDLNT